ncbi:MAG TPA: hypothetical protein VMB20_10290 [Candidatus Acidoferrum sp.]|nr:hypothetical protein [Candidatus Acidoferrum sp.]
MVLLRRFAVAVFCCVLAALHISAQAQTTTPMGKLVLIPYQEPGSDDPHAAAVTQVLSDDLTAAGVTFATAAPTAHLEAVANAAKLCADNNATALLIPDGRYEQSQKRFAVSLIVVVKNETHVEFRLDEVGCDGVVRWSNVATGDQAQSGVYNAGNAGAAVDAAFRDAIKSETATFASAKIADPPAAAGPPAAAAAASAPAVQTYLLIPFGQPGVADPRVSDITHSLLTQMQARKLKVVVAGTTIDHLTAIATAPQLCAANNAQAIVVPSIRLEQSISTGRSHAVLRMSLLNCDGAIDGQSVSDADMGQLFIYNFGAALVGVAERAMETGLDQLFPSTKSTNGV